MSSLAARSQRLSDAASAAADEATVSLARHRESLLWLVGILAVTGVVSFADIGGSPQRTGAEGSAVARALALFPGGSDVSTPGSGSPLGVLQLALGIRIAAAARPELDPLVAGRGVVAVATLVSVVLLWALARRLGLSRVAATVVGLVFVVSPLALTLHRAVSFDDLETPWLLAAVLLVLARGRRGIAVPAAALCIAVALLSRDAVLVVGAVPGVGSVPLPDAALLAVPVLAWIAAREAPAGSRRTTLAAAGVLLLVVGAAVTVATVLRGDPVVAPVVAHPVSPALDPALVVAGLVAALGALVVRAFRPLAVLVLAGALLAVVAPSVGASAVIAVLPVAVLLVVALVDRAVRGRAHDHGTARLVVVGVAAVAAIGVAVATWGVPLRGLLVDDRDAPVRSAVAWLGQEAPARDRILADDAVRVGLVASGRAPSGVSGIASPTVSDWRAVDYLVDTASVRAMRSTLVDRAAAHSVVVASWGSGQGAVSVRRVIPVPPADRRGLLAEVRDDAAASGLQLAANPRLSLTVTARRTLESGGVDPRIPIALGAELATVSLHVDGFPAVEGDALPLRRQVLVDSIDGTPAVDSSGALTPAARQFVGMLAGRFAPARTEALGGGVLLTWSPDLLSPLDLPEL